jgi:diacylglycerol kinase
MTRHESTARTRFRARLRALAVRRLSAFRWAFAGLAYVLRTQPHAWVHSLATILVVALGLWLRLGRGGWALMGVAMGVVWVAEITNTALEAIVDLVSPQPHPLAKIAKDCGAAAVLVAVLMAVLLGALVLGPALWSRVGL